MRRLDPFDKKAMFLSLFLHGAVFTVAWLSTFHRRPQYDFIAYDVELVSPPPAVQAEEPAPAKEELVVERPQPEPTPPPEPEPEPEQAEVAQPEPEPTPPEPEPTPPEPEQAEKSTPAVTDVPPEKTADESGEGINVRMEGLRRDYPEYYNNIILQIQRCFRWRSGGNWRTTVQFVIHRDGSVSDLSFVRQSGNTSFDFEAMGAVDCAGQGRFGRLPEDLPYETLPILFEFSPSGGG